MEYPNLYLPVFLTHLYEHIQSTVMLITVLFFSCKSKNVLIQQQQTDSLVSLLMHTESEISWALVNTKHAIEESSSNVWRSWRQILHVNAVTRYNHTGALRE